MGIVADSRAITRQTIGGVTAPRGNAGSTPVNPPKDCGGVALRTRKSCTVMDNSSGKSLSVSLLGSSPTLAVQ